MDKIDPPGAINCGLSLQSDVGPVRHWIGSFLLSERLRIALKLL